MTTKNNRRDHTNVLPRQSQKHTLKGQWFLFNMPLIVATLLCFLRFPQANSQKTECSCTPLKYRWILNLTNPCPPLFQKNSRGIKDLFCFVDVDVDETDDIEIDETPVDVSSYILIELRTDPDKVDEKYNLTLSDGDPILFESRTLTVEDYISEAFSAEIVGVNAAGYQVKLSVYIEFTNICEEPPFQVGDTFGWLTFNYDESFRVGNCFPSLPFPPSSSPLSNPTMMPSLISTNVPSNLPQIHPTPKSSKGKGPKGKSPKSKSAKGKGSKGKSLKSKGKAEVYKHPTITNIKSPKVFEVSKTKKTKKPKR